MLVVVSTHRAHSHDTRRRGYVQHARAAQGAAAAMQTSGTSPVHTRVPGKGPKPSPTDPDSACEMASSQHLAAVASPDQCRG